MSVNNGFPPKVGQLGAQDIHIPTQGSELTVTVTATRHQRSSSHPFMMTTYDTPAGQFWSWSSSWTFEFGQSELFITCAHINETSPMSPGREVSKVGFLKLAFQQERPRNLLVRSQISPNVIQVILWVLLSSQTILRLGSLEINQNIPSLVPGNEQSSSNSHCQKWFFFISSCDLSTVSSCDLSVICQGSVTSNSEQECCWFGFYFGLGLWVLSFSFPSCLSETVVIG